MKLQSMAIIIMLTISAYSNAQQQTSRVTMTMWHPPAATERTDTHTATCSDGDFVVTVKHNARWVGFHHETSSGTRADITQSNLGQLLLTRGAVGMFGYTCSTSGSVNIAFTGFRALNGGTTKPFRYFGSFAGNGEAIADPAPIDESAERVSEILIGPTNNRNVQPQLK